MLTCTGQIDVVCANCKNTHTIDGADLDFEVVEAHEREQGTESNWEATYDLDCDGGGGVDCDQQISVVYNVWEYPSNQVQTHEPTIDGGSSTGRFNVSFQDTAE